MVNLSVPSSSFSRTCCIFCRVTNHIAHDSSWFFRICFHPIVRHINHNSNQTTARHQNKILLLTCLSAHFVHELARRLKHTSRCYRDYPVVTGSDHLRGAVAANNKHPGFSDPPRMFFFELPRVLFHHFGRALSTEPHTSFCSSLAERRTHRSGFVYNTEVVH